MTDKEEDKKKPEHRSGEHEDKANERSAADEDREPKKKLPEPPGNLQRRAEWFKKRH